MMDILQAARKLRPGTAWNLQGDRLEQAEDGTPRVEIPTMEEINECISSDPLAYRELRASEYPPIGDQLDALWKGGDAASEMLTRIQAVKSQYPKPS